MASLRKVGTFVRTVTALVPSGDGMVEVPFKAEFKILKQDQISGRKDTEILRDALVSVTGLAGEDGQALSPQEQIEDVLSYSPASAAAVAVYVAETTKVETGNSKK